MKRFLPQPAGVLITLAFLILFTALVPPERALGNNLGVVMLHGAWVWAGLIIFTPIRMIYPFLPVLAGGLKVNLETISLAVSASMITSAIAPFLA